MSFWVYMLRCSDGSYYPGHTDNLERRIGQHHAGELPSCYTFKRRPLTVVWSQDFPSRIEALESEMQVKRWSRAKKEALIKGDWQKIRELAKSRPILPRTERYPLTLNRVAKSVVRQAHHERVQGIP